MAVKMQSGVPGRGVHWPRRPATVLCGLALAGAGVLVAPAMAAADQAPVATSAATNPLGSLSADLAVLEYDLTTAVPTTETCVTNVLAGLAIALGQGGTPQPGQPLC